MITHTNVEQFNPETSSRCECEFAHFVQRRVAVDLLIC
jgi:hypothetical protein